MFQWPKIFFLSAGLLAAFSVKGNNLVEYFKNKAIQFNDSQGLTSLIESASGRRLVLLGESTHGTHEYYVWRSTITKKLITEHGYNFIVVEGDFASLYELNRYVKNLPGAAKTAKEAMQILDRWPQWMWRNHVVLELITWLRQHNDQLPQENKVGFYGMDVYDEWRSKEVLLELSQKADPELHQQVMEQLKCFSLYWGDSWAYAREARKTGINCAVNTENLINLLLEQRPGMNDITDYDFFYAIQNAHVINNAEKFYRKSAAGLSNASWNARVHHMHHTTIRLLELYGEGSKGIVWAHNTHIGDASYTDMKNYNQTNIGELSRSYFGKENVFLIGFSTYKGKVQASSQWGDTRQVMRVRQSPRNTLEDMFQRTGMESFYLLFDEEDRSHKELMKPIGHRAIGVIYHPQFDSRQYIKTVVPMRYDALIFIRETKELKPL